MLENDVRDSEIGGQGRDQRGERLESACGSADADQIRAKCSWRFDGYLAACCHTCNGYGRDINGHGFLSSGRTAHSSLFSNWDMHKFPEKPPTIYFSMR